MKCQYFGDKKDLFKWDLAYEVSRGLGLGVTYVPMLTRYDDSGEGNDRAYTYDWPGTKNTELAPLLARYSDPERRCIREIIPFFEQAVVQIDLYRHDAHDDGIFFEHRERRNYFDGIPLNWLSNRLILLDPDKGLQIDNTREKHVQYFEVVTLLSKMVSNSALMIFDQSFSWNEPRQIQIQARLREFGAEINSGKVAHIGNGVVTFWFVMKQDDTYMKLCDILERYGGRYRLPVPA